MNALIQLTKTVLVFLLAWFFFGLLPTMQAVSPAPDGGYPGGNTAEGQNALFSLSSGGYNTANGWNSLHTLSSGSFNTGIGAATLFANTGDQNTAVGVVALFSNSTGRFNTANGAFALFTNTGGGVNTADGYQALYSNITGSLNTGVGDTALYANTAGNDNTAVGDGALLNNTIGSDNIALGVTAGTGVTTADNVICIGAAGNNVDNSCYIGNIFNATSSGGTTVFVNTNGRLGTSTSSKRFKEDIKPINHASETLFALKPVTFRYKKGIDPESPEHKSEFGLVAEDVEKVNPDLVVRDKEGKPYSVRYEQVNAMLLNEFLKAHRRMEEQDKRIEELTAQLKQQAAQIQKVSAQLELSKAAPQTVKNND